MNRFNREDLEACFEAGANTVSVDYVKIDGGIIQLALKVSLFLSLTDSIEMSVSHVPGEGYFAKVVKIENLARTEALKLKEKVGDIYREVSDFGTLKDALDLLMKQPYVPSKTDQESSIDSAFEAILEDVKIESPKATVLSFPGALVDS